jgi:antibiotic biosynthesis monooxygenase (ABM) superfamily enzyme
MPPVIYEVNITVNADAQDEYLSWLRPHITQILAIPGFINANVFSRKEDNPDPEKRYITIQYHLTDEASLDSYITNHAPAFRAEGMKLFGGRFSAQRRILVFEEAFDMSKA